jgi:hypothetical protein
MDSKLANGAVYAIVLVTSYNIKKPSVFFGGTRNIGRFVLLLVGYFFAYAVNYIIFSICLSLASPDILSQLVAMVFL